jgi:hypothetical protein
MTKNCPKIKDKRFFSEIFCGIYLLRPIVEDMKYLNSHFISSSTLRGLSAILTIISIIIARCSKFPLFL